MTSANPPRASITLRLPWPPATLSPNGRANWHAKAADAQGYRFACRVMALQAKREQERLGVSFPLSPPVSEEITFILTNKKARDYVNLYGAFKAGEDGIVDSGLVSGDSCWILSPTLNVELGEMEEIYVRLLGAA